ncbi:MAG: hypothetical protein RIC19_07910 [Phaeodactylibacter sp.]|uniref:hypothetical protein n=1 Tax=Phaeodactylibacter sp. TaxID=1940289 RepID=UPI0032EC86EC
MKRLTIASFLIILFATITTAQDSPWSVQTSLGYQQFEIYNDYRTELMSYEGGNYGRSTGNVTYPIRSLQLGVGINYSIHPRWTGSLQANYTGWKGEYGVDRSMTFNVGQEDEVTHSPRSPRALRLAQFNLIGYYNLSRIGAKSQWQIGTGLSGAFRRHRYETLARYNITSTHDLEVLESRIETIDKWIVGVPLSARVLIPATEKLQFGAQLDFTFFASEAFHRSLVLLATHTF